MSSTDLSQSNKKNRTIDLTGKGNFTEMPTTVRRIQTNIFFTTLLTIECLKRDTWDHQ